MKSSATILNVAMKFGALSMSMVPELIELFDGGASLEDARKFALALSEEVDLKVKVKGVDVLTESVQNGLVEAVVELAWNISQAQKGEKPSVS